MNKVFILQKDLPDCKAGTEFTHLKGTNIYDCGSDDETGRDKIIRYGVSEVENNPEWFKEKQQPAKVTDFKCLPTTEKLWPYQFKLNKPIPSDKTEAVKQAIESVLNRNTASGTCSISMKEFDQKIIDMYFELGSASAVSRKTGIQTAEIIRVLSRYNKL